MEGWGGSLKLASPSYIKDCVGERPRDMVWAVFVGRDQRLRTLCYVTCCLETIYPQKLVVFFWK